ncbi:hypothetical protein [Sphaerothrix gracilis]|uniref:hypothetical protein n=1 Tax=Sphaerothrix gracilis TaxID=3151835 RepID=UPI0031FD0E15
MATVCSDLTQKLDWLRSQLQGTLVCDPDGVHLAPCGSGCGCGFESYHGSSRPL